MFIVDVIIEHWKQPAPTSIDSATSAATLSAVECHSDTIDSDIDMAEIREENEQKLTAMSEEEILVKQKELLSALGQWSFLLQLSQVRLLTNKNMTVTNVSTINLHPVIYYNMALAPPPSDVADI